MVEIREGGTVETDREIDDAYWEQTPKDNQGVYTGFINLLKFSAIVGALVLAFLAATKPAPL